MGHRDDREAERARIAALEDEVEEAKARAERAEQEARAAKEALAAGAKRAAVAEKKAKQARDESVALRKRARRGREPAPTAEPTGPWKPDDQRRYVRVCIAATLCANAVVLPAIVVADENADAFNRSVVLALGATAVLMVVRGVAAKLTGAPGVFSAVITTLLDVPLVLGAMGMAGSGLELDEVLSGTSLDIARIGSALVVWIVGSVIGSYGSADTASSPLSGD